MLALATLTVIVSLVEFPAPICSLVPAERAPFRSLVPLKSVTLAIRSISSWRFLN